VLACTAVLAARATTRTRCPASM